MLTLNVPEFFNTQLNEFLAGPTTQAVAATILISALAGWSILIWRARVRIRRRIRAAVAAYAALELPQ
ncbi:hypothetical protein [Schlesneria paludicola]|uniref:hypothetical protein n=1 Tax=Schlesneria paludicola TaxID=360056 RepID=UPI00029B08D6|nr:hypothetical protein [Schlesneria paludicola]